MESAVLEWLVDGDSKDWGRTDAVARYFPHSPQSIDETMLGRNGRAQLHYARCSLPLQGLQSPYAIALPAI